MVWWQLALIIYGGTGFLLGVFASILDYDNWQYAPLYIVVGTIIGAPLLVIGIIEWMLDK